MQLRVVGINKLCISPTTKSNSILPHEIVPLWYLEHQHQLNELSHGIDIKIFKCYLQSNNLLLEPDAHLYHIEQLNYHLEIFWKKYDEIRMLHTFFYLGPFIFLSWPIHFFFVAIHFDIV